MGDIYQSFGQTLKHNREHAGLTQAGLARMSRLHPSAISRLEDDQREPERQTIAKLARALKLDDFGHDHLRMMAGYMPLDPASLLRGSAIAAITREKTKL